MLAGGAAGVLAEKIHHLILIAHKNSERLVRLINDLLDMEKMESGKMDFRFTQVSVRHLMGQAIEANRGYGLSPEVGLELAMGASDGLVLGDADRLLQVLTNLISNAIKYSLPGGVVSLNVSERGDSLRLSVHDDGAGIPDEFRAQIFDKFAQADAADNRQKGGTGLGLSIARRIVERHGGRIGFDSDLHGGGTTFWVDLQKWQEQFSGPPAHPRVLVCEDDIHVAAILSATLSATGCTVDLAHSLGEARTLLAQREYAALTLDLLLPDGDGLSLLHELRGNPATCALPVIVVSATAATENRLEQLGTLQVAGWLHKPFAPEQLFAMVQCTLYGGTAPLKVLHIEDDMDVIAVVRMALQDIASVISIKTLGAARELLAQESFDAIVLDITLPDGSGLELLEVLREQPGAAPVIIFSAQEAGPIAAAQVQATLIKSKASLDELIEAIKLHTQRPSPQQGAQPR